MRKFCLVTVFLLSVVFAYALNTPRPEGWINDFAGVIGPAYKEKLSALIGELEQKTSAEIAVVTIASIAPYDEKEYARALFDNWKPGKKGKDNGVLVLLALKERRWRIETGYGLEGILPDGLCGEIGRNYMVPYLKEGNYAEGLYQGVIKIAQLIGKDANIELTVLQGIKAMEPAGVNSRGSGDSVITIILFLLLFGILILPILLGRRNNNVFWGGGYGGGGFGGGFGGFGGGGGGGGGAGGSF